MNAHALLAELARRGIRYRVHGADLQIKGSVPDDLAAELHTLKQDVIAALSLPSRQIPEGNPRKFGAALPNRYDWPTEADWQRGWRAIPSSVQPRRSLIDGSPLPDWDHIHLIENCRWADCEYHHPPRAETAKEEAA